MDFNRVKELQKSLHTPYTSNHYYTPTEIKEAFDWLVSNHERKKQ